MKTEIIYLGHKIQITLPEDPSIDNWILIAIYQGSSEECLVSYEITSESPAQFWIIEGLMEAIGYLKKRGSFYYIEAESIDEHFQLVGECGF